MAHIDWDKWRIRYVSGPDSLTLDALSKEPGAPALDTLKKRSSRDSWLAQRERFRHQKSTIAHHDATVEAAAAEVKQIIDSAEMLTRHAQASKLAGSVAMFELNRLRQMQVNGAPTNMKLAEIVNLLKMAIEVERLTEGMATQRQEIDFSALSDAELEKIANGG